MTRARTRTALLAAAAALLAVLPAAPASAGDPQPLVSGLTLPWGLAFLPDGSALVTERDTARVLRVVPGRAPVVVGRVPGVEPAGEGGALGVAVSPRYAQDRTVFFYASTASDNRVLRWTQGRPVVPVLTGIPRARTHNGGRIEFGPDGHLYVGTGDAGQPGLAQDRASLGGKILRITTDGRPAPGNPFGTAVWSLGHRNVQGLAWDPQGRLWASELGQNTWDEVNLVVPGGNYGWPLVEGRGRRAGYRDPAVQWSPAEASPSGMSYYGGSLWVAALRGQRVWRVVLDGRGGVVGTRPYWVEQYGRVRAVAAHPRDGSQWLLTSNGSGADRVLRVTRG